MAHSQSRTFVWDFASPPEAIWTVLADTARFNEAAGLPKHQIVEQPQPDGSVRFFAEAKMGVVDLAWEEIPVEWVRHKWFRHERRFSKGPLSRVTATLELTPAGTGGAHGVYTLEAEAATLLGHVALATKFFTAAERDFTALAQHADAWGQGHAARPFPVEPIALDPAAEARVASLVEAVEASGGGHGLARPLVDWVLAAQEIDVMRIRPIALARAWRVPELEAIELCLEAVSAGLLELRWDLLCPRCRGAKLSAQSLDRLPQSAHCDSCNISYRRDFDRNLELTFHPAPALRAVIDGEFCLFGPMTTPHVAVQVGVAPGEVRDVAVDLPAGAYRLRTLEPGNEVELDHRGGPFPRVMMTPDGVRADDPEATAADGVVRFENRLDRRRTVLIESRAWVDDALTAHQVTTLQSYRDLFPGTQLAPGDEAAISQIALMFTDLKGSTALYERVGDAEAYRMVNRHFAFLAAAVRRHRGSIVKTIGDAVMAAFADPADALRAALEIQSGVSAFNQRCLAEGLPGGMIVKVGLHCGPCIAVTLNERLDYFGATVNMAARLQGQSRGADIVMSQGMAGDPVVVRALAEAGVEAAAEACDLRGIEGPVRFQRLVVREAGLEAAD